MNTATRRKFLHNTLLAATALGCSGRIPFAASGAGIPLIVDTDIGDDIDDTWALLMLLRMQEFDIKLAVGDYGNAIYRARLLAKILDATGHAHIPLGIGVNVADEPGLQSAWVGDYRVTDYPGDVHEDGVAAIIDTINNSPEPVTLLCLGPVPNIAEALRRDPGIAGNARFVGMYGSINVGYDGAPEPAIEWNVRVDPPSLQKAFAAPWDITITPLDTCGLVVLDGDNYRKLYESDDPWLQLLMENYRAWLPGASYMDPATDPARISSTLFDTVAVHLAAGTDFLEMEDLPIVITDDGRTVVDEQNGRNVHCAIGWLDLAAFEQKLVQILLG